MGNLFGDGSGGPGVGGNILDPLDLRKSGATAATQYAADIQNQQAQQALALQQAQFNQVQQNLSPYLYAGYGALPYVAGGATADGFGSMLAQIMGVGPDYNPGQPVMPPYQPIGSGQQGAPGTPVSSGGVNAGGPGTLTTGSGQTGAAGSIGGPFGTIGLPSYQDNPYSQDPKSGTVQQGGGITRNGINYGWSPTGKGQLSAEEAAQLRAYQQSGGNPTGLTTGGVPVQTAAAAPMAARPGTAQSTQATYASPKGALTGETRQTEDGGFRRAGETTVMPQRPNAPQPAPGTPTTTAQTQQGGSRPVQVGFTISRTPEATYVAPVSPNTGQPIVTQNQLGQLIANQSGQPIAPAIPYDPSTQLPGPGGTPAAAPQATYAPKPPYIPGVSPTGATGQPATGFNPAVQAYQPASDAADPFKAIVAERMLAANNQLGQAGLLRSGAAAQAAADIPLDVALQIENMLYGRQANLAGSGQNAAVQQGGFGANTAANQGNLLTQSGQALAQGALGRAQIQAGAQQNAINAASSVVSGLIANAYFSDPRLKMNMEPIGQIHDLTLYEWDWIPEVSEVVGKMSIGFNADEVAEKYPHHIVELAGFKAINYPALTAELRKELEDASG